MMALRISLLMRRYGIDADRAAMLAAFIWGLAMRIDLPVKPALLPFCRIRLAEGADPSEILHVYRGDTLCFVPAPLSVFAALATEEGAARSIRFRKYREIAPQAGEYAPENAEAAGVDHE